MITPVPSSASVERKGATEAALERHWAASSCGEQTAEDSLLELSMKSRKQSWRQGEAKRLKVDLQRV